MHLFLSICLHTVIKLVIADINYNIADLLTNFKSNFKSLSLFLLINRIKVLIISTGGMTIDYLQKYFSSSPPPLLFSFLPTYENITNSNFVLLPPPFLKK